jgi:hypothetical protein
MTRARDLASTALNSAVDSIEYGYLDGVTSAIQTQFNNKAPFNLTVNAQSASYTAVLADGNNTLVTISNASANAFTIPPNSSVAYPVGTVLNIAQTGAGQTTITQGLGVTITSVGATASAPKTRVQYSAASAVQTSANNWLVVGDIA